MNILKALTEKKKTQFRERMLKRYTSEEIRRAFGVAATDKRSDEELLDLIYNAAVGSSIFNIVARIVLGMLSTAGGAGAALLLSNIINNWLKVHESTANKLHESLLWAVFILCVSHMANGIIYAQNINKQQYQQYDALLKLFRSPSKRKRHQPTKPRKSPPSK